MELGRMICRIHNEFVKDRNRRLEAMRMTSSQMDILRYLCLNQDRDINQRDIEQHFMLKNPTVTGILNRLETKELIKRVTSERDARYKNIVITQKTISMADKMSLYIKEVEQKIVKGISDEEVETLKHLLEKVLKNVSS